MLNWDGCCWFAKMPPEMREFSWNWVDALLVCGPIGRKPLNDCWLMNAVAVASWVIIELESADELGCSTWPFDRRWTECVDCCWIG